MTRFEALYDVRPPRGGVAQETLAAIADAHAFEVWGDECARGEAVPITDGADNVFAYVFPYALDQRTYPAEAAPAFRRPDLSERFGAIYVAANRTTQPLMRVVHAPHPIFVRGEEAEMLGRSELGKEARLTKIYWTGLHQEYFEVASGEKRVLMDVRNLRRVAPESALQREAGREESNSYWQWAAAKTIPPQEVIADDTEWEVAVERLTSPIPAATEVDSDTLTPTLKLVPLADCVPAVNWTWWCVPTAFTMATCYYDNYVKAVGGITGYGRLVGYWFDHNQSGHNVPDFIDQLVDPTTGTWRTGFSGFDDFIKQTYGYSFTTQKVSANAANDWAWNEITEEIDAGRPFVWGVPDHATCAFGYRVTTNGKFVVLHTTWGDDSATQREEWPHAQGIGLTTITPGGGTAGQNLEVWQPDGGETLLTNVDTTISWHVWGDQIKTAEILVSTDGGNEWTTCAYTVPCAKGWNKFDWTPQIVTDRARIRIRGLDASGEYVAGDGSQSNIEVLPGPRPVKLKTILVETKTDKTGFFSAPHGLERFAPDGYSIRCIEVAVKHANGNWHTLEFSHAVDNRFWWNKDVVAGVIASPNFFTRPVQIIISAESMVG